MGRPTKHQFRYKNVGRITKLNEEMVNKLETCAALRASVKEICFYCNIHEATYYKWIKENSQLKERLEELRASPILKARETIHKDLKNVPTAFKFLEKTVPEEYGEKIKVEHSGEIGSGDGLLHEEDEKLRIEFRERLRQNLQERWKKKPIR